MLQRLPCLQLPGHLQHAGRHLGGAEVLIAVGDPHAIGGERIRPHRQHGEAIQIGAHVEHLARLGPGAVQQDEERLLARGQGHLLGHPGRALLAGRKHHIGLPDGIRQ
ncbi:hypothetical protein D3C79_739120 [compost metagenome]